MQTTKRRENANRRQVLAGLGLFGAMFAAADVVTLAARAFGQEGPAPAGNGGSPIAAHIKKLAADLAAKAYVKPEAVRPPPFDKLSPEQYAAIKLKPNGALWRRDPVDLSVEPLPMGWIFDAPVELWIVEDGKARSLKADAGLFEFGPSLGTASPDAPYGFSGFRIAAPVSISDTFEEVLRFQGASYFKATGRGLEPGASARGLALNTAQPGGEEFPLFRAFWIEKPSTPGQDVRVYALLDSESATGAYQFTIRPGPVTVIDVELTLIPRKALQHAGIAPLTSMFFHGPADTRSVRDVRPAAHNSEGLAIFNGQGEHLWRPLRNPATLQTSAFVDTDVKGFGLAQRQRAFEAFDDITAHFERRPTVWVEPQGQWGPGFVELIEIPVPDEIHDNIAAYWKPETPLEAGKAHTFAYRLTWGQSIPVAWAGAFASQTRAGDGRAEGRVRFMVDFTGPAVQELAELPTADLSTSAGALLNVSLAKNPDERGIRVDFELDPKGTETVELRLGLKQRDSAHLRNVALQVDQGMISPEATSTAMKDASDAALLPAPAPLPMPPQDFSKLPERSHGPITSAWVPRAAVFLGAGLMTAAFAHELYNVLSFVQVTPIQLIFLALSTITFGWIAIGTLSAALGFLPLFAGEDANTLPLPARDGPIRHRVALLFPVYHEDEARISGTISAITEALKGLGKASAFDVFILSDTRGDEAGAREQAIYRDLKQALAHDIAIHYRRRASNSGRKAGNIKDWVERFGADYESFIILDGDSIMSADLLVRLARAMERDPTAGLIQSVPKLAGGTTVLQKLIQFASNIYGPPVAAGLAFWSRNKSNYWGHNAIIRTRAFASAAGLPDLAGPPPSAAIS